MDSDWKKFQAKLKTLHGVMDSFQEILENKFEKMPLLNLWKSIVDTWNPLERFIIDQTRPFDTKTNPDEEASDLSLSELDSELVILRDLMGDLSKVIDYAVIDEITKAYWVTLTQLMKPYLNYLNEVEEEGREEDPEEEIDLYASQFESQEEGSDDSEDEDWKTQKKNPNDFDHVHCPINPTPLMR